MKVLLDHPNPFMLAHGGFQIQIEQTYRALRKLGVDVEYLRWWDGSQSPDIIHFFGRPSLPYLEQAQKKGIKVITAELLTGTGSRSRPLLWAQRAVVRLALGLLPKMLTNRYAWQAFRESDACIALTPWEAHLMHYIFGAPRNRVHVVPNGVEEEFLSSSESKRGRFLICTATITERKRVLELAQAAVLAKTPLWVFGKPYSATDDYGLRFAALARKHSDLIRYEGPVQDRAMLARAYREARGFVLLSTMESLSLSALEAAACKCPLCLSDLPWARTVFGAAASYAPISPSAAKTARALRQFYDRAPGMTAPPTPLSWSQVAERLLKVYTAIMTETC